MPPLPLTDDARELLRRPCHAVMAWTNSKGEPATVGTWYMLEEDDRVLVNLDDTRARLKRLQPGEPVSLTALDPDQWYTHVSVQGRVVERRADEGLADIDRIARFYTGEPYAVRDQPRTSVWIELDRWHGWGATKS